MQEFLANAVARCLNHLMLALLPSDRRAWGKALVAEQHEITNARERLTWAAGGIFMSANELMRTLFMDRPTWIAGLAFGISSAFVDLNSSTRAIHIRLDPHILASQMGMALDRCSWVKFARNRSSYEQVGAIFSRSVRCVLRVGSCHGRVAGRLGTPQRITLAPAQASWALTRRNGNPYSLLFGHR